MGVWIETDGGESYLQHRAVTPFVGVWIETAMRFTFRSRLLVTPFVGVWIETLSNAASQIAGMSHPSWVCGLKQYIETIERTN